MEEHVEWLAVNKILSRCNMQNGQDALMGSGYSITNKHIYWMQEVRKGNRTKKSISLVLRLIFLRKVFCWLQAYGIESNKLFIEIILII